MTIKILNQLDAPDFRSLRLHSYQESPHAFSESYEDEVKRPIGDFEAEIAIKGEPAEQFLLGAFNENDDLCGFVKFKRDLRSKARHKSMIHAMYVAPAFRGKDIGSLLLKEVIQRAGKMEGLEQIHLWVLERAGKVSAANFYSKFGFIKQGPAVKKDMKIAGEYVDAAYMVKYMK